MADAFKVSRDVAPVFRPDAAQPYDDRILRFVRDGAAVSLWTLEGRMVLRDAWKKPRIPAWWNGWRVVEPHRKIQEQTANRLGFSDRYFDLIHAPQALHKSFFEACDAQHPDWFFENAAYPFRDAQQFWPIGLIAHWAISRHQAEFKSNKSGVMIHAGHHSERVIKARLAKVAADASIQFACLQSMDEGSAACQKSLFQWLDQYIPSWISLLNP
ncbi:MAG: hypothetical protein B7X00_01605 [Legionella sp. 21-45-4]|nr:MAG: hypothetical protein B7X00_01605 [Legionella sp. 21-45-4]